MRNHLSSLFLSLITSATPSPDPERLRLEAISAKWFRGVWISGFVVALGCALETWETFFAWINWRRHRKGEHPLFDDPTSLRIPMAAFGLFLVVGGIVSETIFEVRVSNSDAAIRIHEADRLSAAEIVAGEANERAGEANEKAARLEQGNIVLSGDQERLGIALAQAQRQFEDEHLANLKLEAEIAPRRMSRVQQNAVAVRCQSLKFVNVVIESYAMDAESAILAEQIVSALQLARKDGARLVVVDHTASIVTVGGFSLGVHVTGTNKEAASLIRTALSQDGKLAVAPEDSSGEANGTLEIRQMPSPADDVSILVGVKPVQ
jgi:hypothetical protein